MLGRTIRYAIERKSRVDQSTVGATKVLNDINRAIA